MKTFKRYLVTSALPYANGPIHIGHLAGVYIPSDIYTRFLRMKGVDVLSICGSDEHGVPILLDCETLKTYLLDPASSAQDYLKFSITIAYN